ncbi:MAG: XRE family transcriptional regulator, partial [Deltaproteobacteria bacterium]|nr:XRE family transcriptional regulator [Deltaproteobacteria bacterium]
MDNDKFKTPGQLIESLLANREWSQRVLAIILGADETGINKLIAGKRPVTAEMALLLEEIFNHPADDFLELQKRYDLAKAHIEARPDPQRSARVHLFGGLPITEMIKRGWLDASDIRDVKKVEAALVKFFGATSLDEIEILPHAAQKTNTFTPVSPSQLAWIYRVKKIADEMLVAKFAPEILQRGMSRLKTLLSAPQEARKVPRILAESGVRYVIVESLSSAKIDGVCFWLDDYSPVVGMSLRYDRIDNFWFVLRHELEHVLRGHGKASIMVDAELEKERAGIGDNIQEEERLANAAAADFCVPRKSLDSFVARKAPFFKEQDILGFAATLQIHPGLVAGQLQHRTGRYDRFRQHLVKIRKIVTPNAT